MVSLHTQAVNMLINPHGFSVAVVTIPGLSVRGKSGTTLYCVILYYTVLYCIVQYSISHY